MLIPQYSLRVPCMFTICYVYGDILQEGNTALHMAALRSHGGCVRCLLSIPGIDFNSANHNRQTPIQLATNDEILMILQNAGKQTIQVADYPVSILGCDTSMVNQCGERESSPVWSERTITSVE